MRDILALELAMDVIAENRGIIKNIYVLSFVENDHRTEIQRITIPEAKKWALEKGDRFGLFVLEIIKRNS